MALPPGEIQIKRKRTDEPVDLLRIYEPLDKKPKRATEFIFFRQTTNPPVESIKSQPSLILPDIRSLSDGVLHKSITEPQLYNTSYSNDPKLPTSALNSLRAIPRHFHLSHSTNPSDSIQTTSQGVIRNGKRKAETIFMERKPRVTFKPTSSNSANLTENKSAAVHKSYSPSHHAQKKPGIAARSFTSKKISTPPQICNPRYPFRTQTSWDVNSEELLAQLQAYTLSEINSNDAATKAEFNPSKNDPQSSPSFEECKKSRFVPKAPVLRYKERNPDKIDLDTDIEIEYVLQKETEGDDWVVDTYLRMPSTALEVTQSDDDDINSGFLILDSQAEIEEFYNNETDSGEDDEEDNEDENAENHYTADYPDEEVSSDDEFNRNAYHYSKDVDEFEAENSSDEEDDRTRYPWALKPWLGEPKLAYLDDTDDE